MQNIAAKPDIEVDEIIAAKVAKATALAKHLGPKGFEFLTPPNKLSDKSKPIHFPKFDPIKAAERQLKRTSSGFKLWLKTDMEKLNKAHKVYTRDPENNEKFQQLNSAVHTIKGNAPILGCDSAGIIASPLSDLIERCSDYKKVQPILALAVSAICNAIKNNLPPNDPALLETVTMLHQLNSQCLAGKAQAEHKAQKKTKNQAAGSTSCSSVSKHSSCTPCPKLSCNINCSGST